jgi:hypothetical protein
MAEATSPRAAIITSNRVEGAVLSKRLKPCGIDVIAVIDALDTLKMLDRRPDILIAPAQPGRELRAYYAGRAAAPKRIPIVFIVQDLDTLATQSSPAFLLRMVIERLLNSSGVNNPGSRTSSFCRHSNNNF